MSVDEPRMCRTHPEAIAGWRCTGTCKHDLCAKCTSKLINQFSCCACGAPAAQFTVPRKSKSLVHWLGVAFAYPLSHGLALFGMLALLFGAIPFVIGVLEAQPHELDGVSVAARGGLLALYLLVVIDAIARGGSERGTALRIARAAGATLVVWLPALAYVLLIGVPGARARTDAVMWLYGGLALVYLPIALALAVTDAPLGDLMNPFKVFDHLWRLGRTYVATLFVVALLGAVAVITATGTMASLKHSVTAPLIGDIVAVIPALWVVAAIAGSIGLVTRVHGDLLGWGHAVEYEDPIYPRMKAEGRRKVTTPTPGAADDTASAVVDPVERSEAAKLTEALRTDNLARALRLYEARATWSPTSVDDRKLVMLAKAATRAKKLDQAERMLDDAYARGGRAASQALLALAQLHGDSLGNPDKALEIYRKIIAEFPGSEVAKVAAKKVG